MDHFKVINDRCGHAAGDYVLKEFARAGREALRDTDILGRWGGEEFLLVMPDTPVELRVASLERLRTLVFGIPLPPTGSGLQVSLSAGLASFDDSVKSLRGSHRPRRRGALPCEERRPGSHPPVRGRFHEHGRTARAAADELAARLPAVNFTPVEIGRKHARRMQVERVDREYIAVETMKSPRLPGSRLPLVCSCFSAKRR